MLSPDGKEKGAAYDDNSDDDDDDDDDDADCHYYDHERR
jgi:hypothetical protein